MKIYYGEETKKALTNFPFSYHSVREEWIFSIVKIKKAAALANRQAGLLDPKMSEAMVKACDDTLSGLYKGQFLLSALQGGAGTSINANVNEVLANRTVEILSEEGGSIKVHSNDHINLSQSTNDVNPSALKISVFFSTQNLLSGLDELKKSFSIKAKDFKEVVKLGRTHLQDAVPTTLGAEMQAYSDVVGFHQSRINEVVKLMKVLNLGGTAIGNSMNANPKYRELVYKELNSILKENFAPAENLMAKTSSQSDFLILSQAITALCADLSKIASDLRLMASGPRGGFGEIILPELQQGSSIMPGKTNPIMPEVVNQVYYIISGNNIAIEKSTEAAQLELGVNLPLIGDKLLESIGLTAEVCRQFNLLCITGIEANKQRCKELLEQSTAMATVLAKKIGYDKASELAKKAIDGNKSLKQLVLDEKLLSEKEWEDMMK